MGLADRFKQKLEQNGENMFKTISPKREVKTSLQQETVVKLVTSPFGQNDCSKKFEDLETDIINKIRKTPYWNDYSSTSQENMIAKYFESKISGPKYSQIEYSQTDKQNFINNILILSKNK